MLFKDVCHMLQWLGVAVVLVSASQRFIRVRYLPWNDKYGIVFGVVVGALGLWLRGGWTPG